jgi:hypothetical protein
MVCQGQTGCGSTACLPSQADGKGKHHGAAGGGDFFAAIGDDLNTSLLKYMEKEGF